MSTKSYQSNKYVDPEKQNEQKRLRYATDPEYKAYKKQQARNRYLENMKDPEFVEKQRAKWRDAKKKKLVNQNNQ